MDFLSQLNKQELDNVYENYKKGDMIRIIKYNNSPLNYYKGYIGEIKSYRKGQDWALVFLHSIQTANLIRVPLQHLSLLN
jgi:ribosomal protein L21E